MDTQNDNTDIPDFITLDKVPVNYIQNLETDLLEPVVFNQGDVSNTGFCRFTLQNKGFLHSHSKLFLSLNPTNADQVRTFFAPHVGIGQVIKKAVLKIGNKTLNEVDSWNMLYAVKSSLISNENNKEREQYTTGRVMNTDFRYGDVIAKAGDSKYGLENGITYDGANLQQPEWANMTHAALNECPSYSIDLSDLFPFLKVHQLPLYMINEPINIELTFEQTLGKRVQSATGSEGHAFDIPRSELKFCADYIFYGAGDEMARYAEQNQDMSFSFVDYRLVETSVSDTQLASGVIRNLGMANRQVPRIITTLSNTALGEDSILGSLNSQSLAVQAGVNLGAPTQKIKYNVRYNDRFEFTTDVTKTSRLFTMTTDSEGIPFLTRGYYAESAASALVTDDTYETHPQDDDMSGQFFYLGTRLTSGRVGQRGVELHVAGGFPAGVSVMKNYCEYLRVARLVGGIFEIYNA
jgi:hypothetical protein